MSRISQNRIERIKSNILGHLYEVAPRSLSANEIATLEVRDKEFVLRLLLEMAKKRLVRNVKEQYFQRKTSWAMTDLAYKKYKELL